MFDIETVLLAMWLAAVACVTPLVFSGKRETALGGAIVMAALLPMPVMAMLGALLMG